MTFRKPYESIDSYIYRLSKNGYESVTLQKDEAYRLLTQQRNRAVNDRDLLTESIARNEPQWWLDKNLVYGVRVTCK